MNALVKRMEIYGPNVLTPIQRTDFEYDTVPVVPTPGADRNVLVNPAYRPDLRAYLSANADVIRGNQTRIHRWVDPSVSGNTAKVTTQFKYDAVGNLVSMSDAPQSEQQFIYRVGTQYALPEVFLEGAKTETPDGSQMKTTLVWDNPSGTLSEINRPSVGLTTYVYDASHRVKEIRHPEGVRLVSAESDQGFVNTETSYSGAVVTGRRRTMMNGLGLPTTMYILQDGNAEEVTNIVYDAMGRPARVSSPRNSSATPQWVELGYDGLGRSVSTRYPDGSVEETRFGVSPRPSDVSPTGLGSRLIDAWGRERWLIRDALGKIRQVVEPAANSPGPPALGGRTVTEYTYDPRGLLTSAMSYANQSGSFIASRRFAYDGLGRLIRQYLIERNHSLNESGQPSGTQIWSDIFRYDDRSNLVRHIDPRGVSTLFWYDNDPLNRLQRITVDASQAGSAANPVAPTPERSFEYVQSGDTRRVEWVTVAGLVSEKFYYYDSGQPQYITTYFTDTPQTPYRRSYNYSPKGQLLNVSVRNLADRQEVFGANYLYAPGGRLKHAGGTGLATGLNVDATVQPAGDPEELNYGATGGSLIREVITYDPDRNFLSRHQLKRSTTSILDLQMNFEVVPPGGLGGGTDNRRTGQMTRLTDALTGAPQLLRYDTLGRLKSLINPGKNVFIRNRYLEYTYDRAGNRLTSRALEDPDPCPLPCALSDPTELPAGERDGFALLAYNPLTNRISTPGFEYDAAGNVTRAPRLDGSALKMQYDGHGRLARVTNEGTNEWETYAYDAQGKRVRTENSDGRKDYFLWQGPRVLARFTVPAGSSAPVLDEANVQMGVRLTASVQKNASGTLVPRFINETTAGLIFTDPTSAAPTVIERSRPYGTGTTPISPGQTRKFHSYDRSKLGLDYSLYRFYDPETGRFIQPDPLGAKVVQVSNPQSLNLYAFTQDDPINRRDPLGLDGCGEGLIETIQPDGSSNCSYPYVATVYETVVRAKKGDTDWTYRTWISPALMPPWRSLQAQQDFEALQAEEAIDRALKKRLAALIKQQKACSEARGAFLGAIQDYADITSSLEILYQEKDILKIQSGAEAADVVENISEQAEDPSLGQGAAAGTARSLNIIALNRSFDAKNAQIALTQGQRSRILNKIKAASEAKDAACSTAL